MTKSNNTNITTIDLQAMVVPSTENTILTWVNFKVDLRDRGCSISLANVGDAYLDIYNEICEDLEEEGLLNCNSSPLLYEIDLTNGAKIYLGKFWPQDVIDDDEYVRMWERGNMENSENLVTVLEKTARNNRSL